MAWKICGGGNRCRYWLDDAGIWIEDEKGAVMLDSRASRGGVGPFVRPAARHKIEAVPAMEAALARILVMVQQGIDRQDLAAIEGECRAALGRAWGVHPSAVWTPDLADFEPPSPAPGPRPLPDYTGA